MYCLEELQKVAVTNLMVKLKELPEADVIMDLHEDDLLMILMDVCVDSELKYLALQKWVQGDERRKEKFSELASHIDFSSMSEDFRSCVINSENRQLLQEAVSNLTQSKNRALVLFRHCKILRQDGNEWNEIEGRPIGYSESCVCVTTEGFVVVGGQSYVGNQSDDRESDYQAQNEVFEYKAATGTWKTLPPMLKGRFSHTAAYHQGALYVAGGAGMSNEPLLSVEKFDFSKGGWSNLPNLPLPLMYPVSAIVAGQWYVLGMYMKFESGEDYESRKLLRFVTHKYNDKWEERKDMSDVEDFSSANLVAVNESLYVLGHYDNPRLYVLRYNTFTNQWITIDSHSQHVHRFGLVTAAKNGRVILVLGGEDTDSIEEFDVVSGRWSMCDMQTPRLSLFSHFSAAFEMNWSL
jgi:hypothetical protein